MPTHTPLCLSLCSQLPSLESLCLRVPSARGWGGVEVSGISASLEQSSAKDGQELVYQCPGSLAPHPGEKALACVFYTSPRDPHRTPLGDRAPVAHGGDLSGNPLLCLLVSLHLSPNPASWEHLPNMPLGLEFLPASEETPVNSVQLEHSFSVVAPLTLQME